MEKLAAVGSSPILCINAAPQTNAELLHHCRVERRGQNHVATEFLTRHADCRNFIYPDLIARGLSPFDPNLALARAGRLVLERIREMAAAPDFHGRCWQNHGL